MIFNIDFLTLKATLVLPYGDLSIRRPPPSVREMRSEIEMISIIGVCLYRCRSDFSVSSGCNGGDGISVNSTSNSSLCVNNTVNTLHVDPVVEFWE